MEKTKYPTGKEHYTLYEEIGEGASAKVHRALCIVLNEIVAIKILDFERKNADLNSICRETQTMNLVDHPNLVQSHCSFVCGQYLWVVMPYMAGGSCLHILKSAFQDGFEEVVIATILRQALKGLNYLHQQGHIHRDVKAGNILIDSHGRIKIGDFGVSACLFDSGDRTRMRNTFVGTPCWMAPEVWEQLNGHDYKADIWSFGITALELAHGHAPFLKHPPMKILVMTLQSAPPGLDYERDKKFSKCFKEMIASCLVKDPHRRPSAKKLLKHTFFKQSRSSDYITRKLLAGLPSLADRVKAIKKNEEDMLAEKQMLNEEKAELSQSEYKRGISDWNFNLEDVKAQASLINDEEVGGNSSISIYERQFSNNTNTSNISETSEDQIEGNDYCTRYGKSDDEISMGSSNIDKIPHCCSPESSAIQHAKGKSSRFMDASQKSKSDSERSTTTVSTSDLGDGPNFNEEPTNATPIISNATSAVNNEEVEDKVRAHVIQQKSRFKVTSENVDIEKVIKQHPVTSPLSSPRDHPATNTLNSSMFTMLHSFLQTNIIQRENVLQMMKNICSTEFSTERYDESPPLENIVFKRSMLDRVHDRENELLHEIIDLQSSLVCAKEELHKLKVENAQVNQ